MADQATLDAMIEKFRVIIKDNNVELVSSINKGVDEKIDKLRAEMREEIQRQSWRTWASSGTWSVS